MKTKIKKKKKIAKNNIGNRQSVSGKYTNKIERESDTARKLGQKKKERVKRCQTMEPSTIKTIDAFTTYSTCIFYYIHYWLLRWKVKKKNKKTKTIHKLLSILENRSNVLNSKDVHLIIIFCCCEFCFFSYSLLSFGLVFLSHFVSFISCFAIVSGIQYTMWTYIDGQWADAI